MDHTGAADDGRARYASFYRDAYLDVLRFVLRRLPVEAAEAAEDVVAEAFLTAWRRWAEAPADDGEARAWVFGVARNCLLNARRSAARRAALEVRVLTEPAGPGPSGSGTPGPDAVDSWVDLAAAWKRLRPADQETLALVAFEELTPSDAARVLGIRSETFRVRLLRARRALRSAARSLEDARPPLPQNRTESYR